MNEDPDVAGNLTRDCVLAKYAIGVDDATMLRQATQAGRRGDVNAAQRPEPRESEEHG